MIINRLFATLALATLITCTTAMAGTLTATTDRTDLSIGETVNLTINTDSSNSDSPDLSELKKQFDIEGVQQSSQAYIINGKSSFSNNWTLVIKPKAQGKITIPPISIGNQQTNAITLMVKEAPKELTSLDGKELLKAETSLDTSNAYIQQQVILTLRLYAAPQGIRVNSLIPPELKEAGIAPIGNDISYTKQIDGTPYTIVERHYNITPQKSGQLKIPSFILLATIQENNQLINKIVPSNEVELHVKPKPSNYPANTPWLPAKKIVLAETWSSPIKQALQGNSLTRTIHLTAFGLSSNQLDPLPKTMLTSLRSYPEQPVLKDTINNNTLVGTRQETEAIIPIEAGNITLPEIKIAWWNVDKDRLEYATIPSQTMIVRANPTLATASSISTSKSTPTIQNPTIRAEVTTKVWIWQLLTGLFAITSIIGFYLWFYARKQPAIIKETATTVDHRTLLGDIKRACQSKDPQAARQALDNWAKQQPETLAELAARFTQLSEALDELNSVLYSENDKAWQGDKLWAAIQSLPEKIDPDTTPNSTLPPLYPK